MLHTPSNRGTPVSGEHITKLVRQHYKPLPPEPYRDEAVQCRTDTTCQLGKPDDYWITNFSRRQQNFDKGFYTAPTVPYRPIGGELVLDSCELVMSSLPGSFDKKLQSRMLRRGTIFDTSTPQPFLRSDAKSENASSTTSQDLVDMCPSAGFEDIKKLMRESCDRIVCVKAGRGYEDHVKALEEQAIADHEAMLPDDTGMTLQSLSSLFLPISTVEGCSRKSSPRSVRVASTSKKAKKLGYSDNEKKCLDVCGILDTGPPAAPAKDRTSPVSNLTSRRPRSMLRTESNKLSLMQCTSGFTAALLRKERQFRDHLLFLQWIHNILTAMHNMKLKDIRSKVPLPREMVERLQKEGSVREEERSSRATYIDVVPVTSDSPVRRSMEPSPRKAAPWFSVLKRKTAKASIVSRFCKSNKMSVTDTEMDDGQSASGRMSIFGAMKRINTLDSVGKTFSRDGRRRSRNAMSLAGSDRPTLETWEDLLNVQPQEYKEEPTKETAFGFQVGIVTKFMKWYRRASNLPSVTGALPALDRAQLSSLQEQEKNMDGKGSDKEPAQHGQPAGSAPQPPPVKRLPIWQQVAQEKSTVFHNKKSDIPNPDTAIVRFRQDLNKLKRSLQKENNAELEKIVRERVATFRLKFSTLDPEECSSLFEEQIHRIEQARENVNKSHLENFDVQPSKWYEELREKTNSLVSNFDQPKIIERIGKLQTYAHMDNKTVPYAKAKLCLLMMSLPAYDICQIYVQRSLKFIFENILLGQEAQFEEWLNHRRIPYMVYNTSQPRSPFSKE